MEEMDVPSSVLDDDDRRVLLERAATLLDQRGAHLGAGDETPSTPEGDLARIFATDRATLGRPDIHRIAASQIDADRRDATLTDSQLERRHRHYWLALPVSLWTRPGCAFNQLQVKVNFNPSDEEARRPTAFDALPDQELVTRFEASSQLELGVGADFHITAKLPDVPGELVGLPLVVRVPDGVDRLEVSAQMVATRYVSLFSAGLRQSLRDLPAKLREFFAEGTPIAHAATWDLTEEL